MAVGSLRGTPRWTRTRTLRTRHRTLWMLCDRSSRPLKPRAWATGSITVRVKRHPAVTHLSQYQPSHPLLALVCVQAPFFKAPPRVCMCAAGTVTNQMCNVCSGSPQPAGPGQLNVTQAEYDAIVEYHLKELWGLFGPLTEVWFDGTAHTFLVGCALWVPTTVLPALPRESSCCHRYAPPPPLNSQRPTEQQAGTLQLRPPPCKPCLSPCSPMWWPSKPTASCRPPCDGWAVSRVWRPTLAGPPPTVTKRALGTPTVQTGTRRRPTSPCRMGISGAWC